MTPATRRPEPAVRTVAFARHGEATWTGHRYAGHSDIPLTDLGHRQARALATRIADAGLLADPRAVIIASPLQRALDTARAVADVVQRPVAVDERWIEVDFGALEGHTFDEATERWPRVVERLLAGDTAIDWPDGERWEAFRERVEAAWEAVEALDAPVLVVSHGITIRAAVGIALASGTWPEAGAVVHPAETVVLRGTEEGWRVDPAWASGASSAPTVSAAPPDPAAVPSGPAASRDGV
jgi:broad specificity phosphatase PhoE